MLLKILRQLSLKEVVRLYQTCKVVNENPFMTCNDIWDRLTQLAFPYLNIVYQTAVNPIPSRLLCKVSFSFLPFFLCLVCVFYDLS